MDILESRGVVGPERGLEGPRRAGQARRDRRRDRDACRGRCEQPQNARDELDEHYDDRPGDALSRPPTSVEVRRNAGARRAGRRRRVGGRRSPTWPGRPSTGAVARLGARPCVMRLHRRRPTCSRFVDARTPLLRRRRAGRPDPARAGPGAGCRGATSSDVEHAPRRGLLRDGRLVLVAARRRARARASWTRPARRQAALAARLYGAPFARAARPVDAGHRRRRRPDRRARPAGRRRRPSIGRGRDPSPSRSAGRRSRGRAPPSRARPTSRPERRSPRPTPSPRRVGCLARPAPEPGRATTGRPAPSAARARRRAERDDELDDERPSRRRRTLPDRRQRHPDRRCASR